MRWGKKMMIFNQSNLEFLYRRSRSDFEVSSKNMEYLRELKEKGVVDVYYLAKARAHINDCYEEMEALDALLKFCVKFNAIIVVEDKGGME